VIVILMGPAGSGKTTVGKLLAAELQWEFADADTFHSPANIDKMSHGVPLRDEDRLPWLYFIRAAMLQWDAQRRNVVLACSALKRSYRELLLINSNVKLVYLKGSYELFLDRLRARTGHYAGEKILPGQFADLEEPTDAIIIDAALPPAEIVAEIRAQLSIPQDALPLEGREL
jgi:gluconokinase